MSSNRLSFHKIRQLLRLKWDVGMSKPPDRSELRYQLAGYKRLGRGLSIILVMREIRV